MEATDRCEISPNQRQINIVLLLDASGSLGRTDPANARKAGLEAAVVNLANLAGSNPNVDISIAVDTFSTGYSRRHGWQDARESQQTLSGRYNAVTALPATARSTDYREALRGVAGRFREVPVSNCNLLLWFTDGEHATEGTSSDVSEGEWQQLQTLCASDDMAYLSARSLYTVGVLLSPIDAPVNSAPLRQLFGEGGRPCPNPLDGDIRDDVGANDLRDALDELINEVVYEAESQSESEDDLPGEEPGLPDDNSYRLCSGGDGNAASPCEYSFALDPETESFRLFLDMTFLGRGISNPGAINIVVRSPSGKQSGPIVPTAQQDDTSVAQYQPVRPFWFLSRRPYDSRWEIIGHQAAEQIANDGDWEWAGEWSLLFWGDTPDAANDAAKVAAAFRAITFDAPVASMSLNDEGKLIGFIENFPNEYKSVELNMELSDTTGALVYPTRPHLTCESTACDPVPVSDTDNRFEVPRLLQEVVWWDSEASGGDGLRLQAALSESGPISADAVLRQEFFYGGISGYGSNGDSGQPLQWSRGIGALALDGLPELLASRQEWQILADWVDSGAPQALPFDLRLLPAPYDLDGDKVAFRVEVRRGYLPGMLTLEDVRTRIGAGDASAPTFDQSWSCEVPGGNGQADNETHSCPAIRVDLNLSQDNDVTALLELSIVPSAGLDRFESLAPSKEEWDARYSAIRQAAEPRRETLESQSFRVDLPTPADKFSAFLPILLALVALAGALRFFVATRLRPWTEIVSPEYSVKGLPEPPDYQPSHQTEIRNACMDLTSRTVAADVGGVTLLSRWRPLLLGRPPQLVAKAVGGRCFGPAGSYRARNGEQIGIIGSDLRGGWVVYWGEQTPQLVVWDLPVESAEQPSYLADAEADAIEKLQEQPQRAPTADAGETSERAKTAVETSDPFEEASDEPYDPFA